MSLKFRLPVSRMMYVLMVVFLAATVVLVGGAVLLWIGRIQTNPPMSVGSLLAFVLVGPIGSFACVLYIVKCIFFNCHELTDRELIVSAPPFHRVRVPLEEIIEIETDAGKIDPSLGKSVKCRKLSWANLKVEVLSFMGLVLRILGGKR